ncbi:permease [Geopsychrobacter electrodiphilus]|uniref:permease n=1 Tax=Geopsychrobacter electrodiphilus TaxID=225196 RepID=UPI00037B6FE9|nr:permease [Geopsychrobacter electrodiphilus]
MTALTKFFMGLLRQRMLLFVGALYLGTWLVSPQKTLAAFQAGYHLFLSVTILIIAVFAMAGLLQTWIGREMIGRVLGREGGFKGLLLGVGCGAILIGPSFVIFPLLMSLRRLGARWAVVAIVLAAYGLKPQMLPVEAQFLGLPFALVRGGLTLMLAIPLGLAVERLMPEDERN